VDIATLDGHLANQLGINFVPGVWVKNVDPKGSAARAGVRPNDIIVKINGRPVTSVPELQEMVARSQVGETISLGIVREGKERTLQVTLRSLSE